MRKIFYKILLISLSILILNGCSKPVPGCMDSLVTDLVKQIADTEMNKKFTVLEMDTDITKYFTYNVDAIRTTNTNNQTGAHECAAELTLLQNDELLEKIPINYTVENTDKGDEIYVNVFGLEGLDGIIYSEFYFKLKLN